MIPYIPYMWRRDHLQIKTCTGYGRALDIMKPSRSRVDMLLLLGTLVVVALVYTMTIYSESINTIYTSTTELLITTYMNQDLTSTGVSLPPILPSESILASAGPWKCLYPVVNQVTRLSNPITPIAALV